MSQSEAPLLLKSVRLPGGVDSVDLLCEKGLIRARDGSVGHVADADVIDCEGFLALPAFVDVHSHADGRVWKPELSLPKAQQGIALEVAGNCGIGPGPGGDIHSAWGSLVASILGGVDEEWQFSSFGDYYTELQQANQGIWPHLRSLVPYGAIRASVAPGRNPLSEGETEEVRRLIERGLADGALGVSLGLVYPPSDIATMQELIATLRPLSAQAVVLSAHVRSQANNWMESIDEVIRLANALSVRLLISHLCVGGKRNQWKLEWVLARLSRARAEGVDVWFDQHPYAAGATSLSQLLPPWLMKSSSSGTDLTVGAQELTKILESPSARAGWENYVELIGPEQILIVGAPDDPALAGRTLASIQEELDSDIGSVLAHLIEVTSGRSSIVLLDVYEESSIEMIAAEPFGLFSTDGVHSELPHPRLYGTYPYAFHRFVHSGVMSETEFVARSSERPAQVMNLGSVSGVQVGAPANLVIVDEEHFDHTPNYLNPFSHVKGIHQMVLGGRPVSWEEG